MARTTVIPSLANKFLSQSAALRRSHTGMAEEYEEKGANFVVGNGDECSVRVGGMENNNSINNIVQLMRGLIGRLDGLEEIQSKIRELLSGAALVNKIANEAQMSPGEDLKLFASGLVMWATNKY
uniref:AlNc14C29G2767 protein n=1 Tax=Albugo laibachii Nc14 TaxID=890382 RepID=F0W7F0_9STRA|nr:AlNc14C29G2767 [Albugo laibachii Nc14]|eukprot:CCA17051.1 AlNc14C29G2767 [Albugo laibachii Nc14]